MEDALRVRQPCRRRETTEVLILVLMEDALRDHGVTGILKSVILS